MQSLLAARSLRSRPGMAMLGVASRRPAFASAAAPAAAAAAVVPSRTLLTFARSSTTPSLVRPKLQRAAPSPHLALLYRSYATPGRFSRQHVPAFNAFFGTIFLMACVAGVIGLTFVVSLIGGSHLYVEYVTMPRMHAAARADAYDEWGWREQLEDESWGDVPGTDPRLGFSGRYTVRSAWISSQWGGGISPELLFSNRDAPGSFATSDVGKAQGLPTSNGLREAEAFLDAALRLAEEKGIRLPDLAANRAGLAGTSPASAAAVQGIDPTAVALESRLAEVRERMGEPAALQGALAGYTRLYDVLAGAEATRRQVGNSGIGEITQQRLVRLARRIGDVNAALGKTDDAKEWLLRAVDLSGNRAELQSHNAPPVPVNALPSASAAAPGMSSAGAARDAQGTPIAPASAASSQLEAVAPSPSPSPSLTRALISTLVSLSALYAQAALSPASSSEVRSNLEQALQVQAGALRIARTELQRLNLTPGADGALPVDAKLHSLWLMHHDALVSLHLAETMYGLTTHAAKDSGLTAKLGKLFSSSATLTEKELDFTQSKAWLAEASAAADVLQAALRAGNTTSTKKKNNNKMRKVADELGDEWKTRLEIELPAERLLRDAGRVGEAAKEMLAALD